MIESDGTGTIMPRSFSSDAIALPELPPHIWVRLSDRDRIKSKLRISLTDGCNLGCFFCHNEGQGPLGQRVRDQLSPDEITAVVRTALAEGVSKVKLTGGEPLLYRYAGTDIVGLVGAICSLRDNGYVFDLSVTTNGTLLARYAAALRRAGLDRATISLTTVADATFRALISSNGALLGKTLDGLRAAERAGMDPIKVNMPIYRSKSSGLGNLSELEAIIEVALGSGVREVRLFTLLWHEDFDRFDEYYEFFTDPVLRALEALFLRYEVPDPPGTVGTLSELATVFADRLYPKVEFGIEISGLRLGFEAMKYGRLTGGKGLQEGPYAMRMGADGALRATLQAEPSYDLLNGISSGMDDEALRYIYRESLEGIP